MRKTERERTGLNQKHAQDLPDTGGEDAFSDYLHTNTLLASPG